MEFDEFELEDIATSRPENLFWVKTSDLLSYAKDEDNPRDVRRTVVAELVARWCLSNEGSIARFLSSTLPDWTDLADWYRVKVAYQVDREIPPNPGLWRDPPEFPGCEALVRQRLLRLFRVDGFIPVFIRGVQDSGLFIPFELEKSATVGVVWADGTECVEWNDDASQALLPGWRCKLQVTREPCIPPPEGASLMLPLRMACWRKSEGSTFPKYDALRVVATGRISEGRLASVRTVEKFKALKREFCGAVLIGPDIPGEIGNRERSYLRIDVGTDMDRVKQAVCHVLERASLVDENGLAKITWRYVYHTLPDMRKNVDRLNRQRWSTVADMLGKMKEKLRDRASDAYLEFMTLHAVALCHAGRTVESVTANREAYAYAMERGKVGMALLLQIEEMVNAQDMGNLDELATLRTDVGNRLAAYDGDDADDLRMRYHGTTAQCEMWGTLMGLPGFSKSEALANVTEAVRIAKQVSGSLCGSSDPEAVDEAESNVQQDLNYVHLYHAIFAAGSGDERSAWQACREQLDELSISSRDNNEMFLRRQKSLAYLNAWRESGIVPTADELSATKIPGEDPRDWLIAANRSHLGVLYAALKLKPEMQAAFAEGDAKLPLDRCPDAVLGAIRLVLLVRAACAMWQLHEEAEGERYLELAKDTHSKFAGSRLFMLMNAARLIEQAESRVGLRDLPAFYY